MSQYADHKRPDEITERLEALEARVDAMEIHLNEYHGQAFSQSAINLPNNSIEEYFSKIREGDNGETTL